MSNLPVIDWLLEEDQPSVRYYALVDLLGRTETDPEVREAFSEIPKKGWARKILQLQKPGGYWEAREPAPTDVAGWLDFLYRTQYIASAWRALVLSDLGLTSREEGVRKISELFFREKLQLGSGVNFFTDEVCLVGNVARMLTRFGYGGDYRVKKLFDRLLEDQKEDGGWHCFPSDRGTLDGWEGLAAFAALPKSKRTGRIQRSIDRGVEFYLQRRLFDDGEKRYPPWFRFHYPVHCYYDILVGLDVVTSLGYGDDRRLRPALKILRDKRRSDGTWVIDRVHPDLGPGAGYTPHTKKIRPFALERAGEPSKWITLTALRVLNRVEEAS